MTPLRATMQNDGNFVLYFAGGDSWSTYTSGYGTGPYELRLTRDAEVQVVDNNDVVHWTSGAFSSPFCLISVVFTRLCFPF
jgi:hypothetical protein